MLSLYCVSVRSNHPYRDILGWASAQREQRFDMCEPAGRAHTFWRVRSTSTHSIPCEPVGRAHTVWQVRSTHSIFNPVRARRASTHSGKCECEARAHTATLQLVRARRASTHSLANSIFNLVRARRASTQSLASAKHEHTVCLRARSAEQAEQQLLVHARGPLVFFFI